MHKTKITSILIQHEITKLTRQEAEFLMSAVHEMRVLYRTGGISLRTLCRQHGLTKTQVKDIIVQGHELIAKLETQQANPCRKSSIFKDNDVLDLLLDNLNVIVDYYEEGYERETIYQALSCIPSNRVWTKFRTLLKKQGVTLTATDTTEMDLISTTA